MLFWYKQIPMSKYDNNIGFFGLLVIRLTQGNVFKWCVFTDVGEHSVDEHTQPCNLNYAIDNADRSPSADRSPLP